MAKRKPTNSTTKAAGRAVNVAKTMKNKAAKLARHVKAHPNDKQSAARVGKDRAERKAPFNKGSAPKVNRHKAYLDEAGHRLGAPIFAPVLRKAK